MCAASSCQCGVLHAQTPSNPHPCCMLPPLVPPPSRPPPQKAIAAEYAEHNWAELGAPGAKKGLTSLTIPTLKIYLQHHSLKLTGNKGEIVARIQEHLQQQQQQAGGGGRS